MSAANIQKYMNTIAIKLNRGSDRPDLIVADDNYYNLYLQSLQAIQRITRQDGEGRLHLAAVRRRRQRLRRGSGALSGLYANSGMTASAMYFLNTDYLYFRPHAERNFKVDDAERVRTRTRTRS
jgi:hypothetical protein